MASLDFEKGGESGWLGEKPLSPTGAHPPTHRFTVKTPQNRLEKKGKLLTHRPPSPFCYRPPPVYVRSGFSSSLSHNALSSIFYFFFCPEEDEKMANFFLYRIKTNGINNLDHVQVRFRNLWRDS